MSREIQNSEQVPSDNQLSLMRTWLSHERTLMSWVRTAASMISFGFTIYKFFQYEENAKIKAPGVLTPRDFGLMMISIGLLSLILAAIGHHRQVRILKVHQFTKQRSLAELVAALVSAFGILALIATALRT